MPFRAFKRRRVEFFRGKVALEAGDVSRRDEEEEEEVDDDSEAEAESRREEEVEVEAAGVVIDRRSDAFALLLRLCALCFRHAAALGA